ASNADRHQILHALPHDLAHPRVTHVSPLSVHAHAQRTPPDQGPPCTCNPAPNRGAGSARPAPRTASGHTARDSAAGTPRTAGTHRAHPPHASPDPTTREASASSGFSPPPGTAR